MIAHVGHDEDILEDAEEGIDVRLAVLVVPHVEQDHQGNADQVDGQNCFLVPERFYFVATLRNEAAPGEEEVGEAHVAEGADEKDGETKFVNFESLLRRNQTEAQQPHVLHDIEPIV